MRNMRYLIAAGTLLLGGTALAADIPVNTGLWEMTTTVSIAGLQLPPQALAKLQAMGLGAPGQPMTQTLQSCVTEQTLAKLANPSATLAHCRRQNVSRSTSGLSFDLACDHGATGHVDMVFDDRTHAHASAHVTGSRTDGSGRTTTYSADTTHVAHWLSKNCGAVKPLD